MYYLEIEEFDLKLSRNYQGISFHELAGNAVFELNLLVYYISAFQNLQNSIPSGPPLHYVLVFEIHVYVSKMTLSNLLTKTSLLST